jgi:hypothetical protein
MRRIKMKTISAGPDGAMEAGKVYPVSNEIAQSLVNGGYAEYVEDLKLEKAINQEELEKALHPEAKHLGGGWYEYKGEKMRKADLPNGS